MAGVPNYSAARNGVLGDISAVDASAQINQFLGSHGVTPIYAGTQILTPNGPGLGDTTPISFWRYHLDGTDYDQPFTMSSTAIGRVSVPALPVGAGADLIVSLCLDSAGSPGAPIATTRIPAAWITQLAAVAGVAGPSSALQLSTPASAPLATPQFNALMFGEGISYNWTPPAPTSSGAIVNPVAIASGNYMVMVGGSIGTGGAANVYTAPWDGGSILGAAVSQPSLPEPLALTALMANSTTLITAGGATTTFSGLVSSVYSAGWNPTTGQVSAWSQQTALPQAVAGAFGAATDTAVYVVGGQNGTPSVLSTVYWSTISNGQISSWNTGPPLPVALKGAFVTIIGNYLVVVGGYPTVSITSASTALYYAVINADGSLNPWQSGPPMPYGVGNQNSGYLVWNAEGLTVIGGYNGVSLGTEIQNLSFGPNGPGVWSLITLAGPGGNAEFLIGPGQWQVFSLYSTSYATAPQYQVPQISVPLPASGLTNGATYHILMRQAGGDLNDYLRMPSQFQAFPGNPTVQSRASSGGSSWTPDTSGNAVPITIYNQVASGQPIHLLSDSGASHTMMVNTTTPDGTLLGVLEATAQPGPVLNINSTFTNGTTPWTVTGGTLTQSTAHTRGNLPAAGLLTPSGTDALSFIESDQVAVLQSHDYTASAWLYSPTGYASCAVNINWHDSSGAFLSRVTGTVTSVPATTWTQLVTTSTGGIPASAAFASIIVVESGTPPATAVLYLYATIQDVSGPMLAEVSQINYTGSWPAAISAPLGVTPLA